MIESNANTHTVEYDTLELKEIFDLTLRLCQINPKSKRRSKVAHAYWERLVRLWKVNIDTIGYNVIYAALFCIYWGVYPLDMPNNADLLRLVDLVKREFLKTTKDTESVKERQFFSSSLTAVLMSTSPHTKSTKNWKSHAYRQYLNDHIKYKLYGGEYVIEKLDLLAMPHSTFDELKQKANTRKRYETFEKRLIRVLPEAKFWTEEFFLNDAYILERLKAIHGIDYSRKWRDFDCLIEAINYIDCGSVYSYVILNMEKVPTSLAKIIWPNNTESCIEQLFNRIFTMANDYLYMLHANRKHTQKDNDQVLAMMNTWLYRQIDQWRKDKTYIISDETRQLMFNFALRI